MGDLVTDIFIAALFIIAALSFGGFLLLVWFYRRNEARERDRFKQTKADIADMTILFQTMRDIIRQQKELAREFNERLDQKMGVVKEILGQGIERNKQLYEKQQSLGSAVEDAERNLKQLREQIARTPGPASHPPEKSATPVASATTDAPSDNLPDARIFPETDTVSAPEKSTRMTSPQRDAGAPAAFADWTNFDMEEPSAKEDEPEEEEVVDAPLAPEDPQAARDAFRALLDLDPHAAPMEPELPMAEEDTGQTLLPEIEGMAGGNGSDRGMRSPLQRRVMEYRDAGMNVAQIARELGIGKGEVRLMLSLLKQSTQ
jgi:hypothetical protein